MNANLTTIIITVSVLSILLFNLDGISKRYNEQLEIENLKISSYTSEYSQWVRNEK